MNSVLQIIEKTTSDEFNNKGYSFNLDTGINSYSFLPPFLFEKSGSVTIFKINKVLHHNTKVTIDDSLDLVSGDILTDGDNKYINEVTYISDFKGKFYAPGYGYFQYEITVDGIDYKSQVFKLINIEFPYPEMVIDLDIDLNNRWTIYAYDSGSIFELDNGDSTTQTVLCDTLDSGSGLYYGITEDKTYVGTGLRTVLIKTGDTNINQLAGITEFGNNFGTVAYNSLKSLGKFIYFGNNGSNLLSTPIFPDNSFYLLNFQTSLDIDNLDFSNFKGIKRLGLFGLSDDTRNIPLLLPTSPIVAMEKLIISFVKNIYGEVDLTNQYGTIEFKCDFNANMTGFTFGSGIKLLSSGVNIFSYNNIGGDFFTTLAVDPTNRIGVNLSDNNMISQDVDNNIIDFNNKCTGDETILQISGNNAARTSASDAAVLAIEGRGGGVFAN